MEIFLLWLVLSILVAVFANNRGRSGILYFFISIILSPLLGFLIALISGDVTKMKCFKCGQKIDISAKVCPFCLDNKVPKSNNAEVEVNIENKIIKKEDNYKLILKKNFTSYTTDDLKDFLINVYDGKCTPLIKINDDKQFFIKGIVGDDNTTIQMKNEESSYVIESYKIPIPEILINQNYNNKSATNVDRLIELGKLYKDGILTKEEFEEQKNLLKSR